MGKVLHSESSINLRVSVYLLITTVVKGDVGVIGERKVSTDDEKMEVWKIKVGAAGANLPEDLCTLTSRGQQQRLESIRRTPSHPQPL